MKKILLLTALTAGFLTASAQVGVERTNVRGDGIMDFPGNGTNEYANRGILLPKVANTANIAGAGGALAFNIEEQRVEFYNAANGGEWLPLSAAKTGGAVSGAEHAGSANRFADFTDAAGMLIEAGTTSGEAVPEGVLVLESNNKALILPQVENAALLPSPKPGLICYDMYSKSIAVFNGTEWSFWN